MVIQVDRAEGKVTLDHKEIKGLVPAMSMEYGVESPGLLRGVKSGERVRFKLSLQGVEFVVVEIEPDQNP